MNLQAGDFWGKGKHRKKIREIKKLSNGWCLIKTDNSKSNEDFMVKVVFNNSKSMTPKHAHFLIDFYGKLCAHREKALNVLKAIYEVWKGKDIDNVIATFKTEVSDLPGYPLEYILYALNWILHQEDINFNGKPEKKQKELDALCKTQNIETPEERQGSQLAIALFCDVANSTHPVEALLKANLDIKPKNK